MATGRWSVEGRRRTVDLLMGLLLGSTAAPLVAVLAVVIRIKLGSPVVFRQERAGLHGNIFVLYKFRSMTDERDEAGLLLSDAQRLTAFGRWLRSTSLDEVPELWNVVCGDMAIVGPRPLPVSYLSRYTKEEARRHEVRPGLTGLAQVKGRNSMTWEERLAMDVWYVDNRSLWLDLRIVAATVRTVLQRRGVSAEGHATMHEFRPELRSN